jgi:hypothetical protein
MFAKLKDGVKRELNKLTSSTSDASGSPAITSKAEDCTADQLLQTDWNLIGELCDLVNEGDIGCEY